MKRLLVFMLVLLTAFVILGCDKTNVEENGGKTVYNENDVVGNDWHSLGIYDFVSVGDLNVGIKKVNNDQNERIGYDVHRDGDTEGDLLCELRIQDGGYLPQDLDIEAWLIFEDFNGDGFVDIGLPVRNGDTIWYAQKQDEYGQNIIDYAGIVGADADEKKNWHDYGTYTFEVVDENLKVGIIPVGDSGSEVGFNVYEDEGSEQGSTLCEIRFEDGSLKIGYFDVNNCLVFEDYNKDGKGDIGVKTKQGDILWYTQGGDKKFSYLETEADFDFDLSQLSGEWTLDDEEYSGMKYQIDSLGKRYDYSADYHISSGLILPMGQEEGYEKYQMIDELGEHHDYFYLISENSIRFGDLDHPDPNAVEIYNRTK